MQEQTDESEQRDPAEADRIRDEALRRALAMPPIPLKDMKIGKPHRRKREPVHAGADRKPDQV